MKRTLQQQIAANRNASLVYASMMIVLLAALGGAIGGYYAPDAWYVGAGGAAVLGVVVALVSWYGGPGIVLSISQAREATDYERQVVDNVAEEMALAAGIPTPKVYIIDDTAPNAFATGAGPKQGIVAVTTGLIRKLDRDELQGVVAHEIAHIRNYDIRLMTTLAIVAGLIPLLADVFMRSVFWGGGRSRSRSNNDNNGAALIFLAIGILLAILAPIFAKMLELAVSRKREYLADATAAELTRYPEGLARALEKIARDPEPLEVANRATEHMFIINPLKKLQRAASLFSTHPPTDERIAALRGLMGAYQPPPIQRTPTFGE